MFCVKKQSRSLLMFAASVKDELSCPMNCISAVSTLHNGCHKTKSSDVYQLCLPQGAPGCRFLRFVVFVLYMRIFCHPFADIAGMEVSVDARSRDDGCCLGERSRNTQNVSSISFTFHVLTTDWHSTTLKACRVRCRVCFLRATYWPIDTTGMPGIEP